MKRFVTPHIYAHWLSSGTVVLFLLFIGSTFPIKNLAFFANYQLKFVEALQTAHQKGNWVKTVARDFNITTYQTNIASYFIDGVIEQEDLEQSDIIMLKYLKRIDQQRFFSIYKIFNSVDQRQERIALYYQYICRRILWSK